MKKIRKPAQKSSIALRRFRHKTFRKKIRGAVKARGFPEDKRAIALALAGIGGRSERLLASDTQALNKAAMIFRLIMLRHLSEHPDCRLIFATFVDDVGITSDRSPMVHLGVLQTKVRQALMKLGLEAFAMVEAHPLMNYPGKGLGGSILYHAHAIIFAPVDFNHKAAEDQLNASGNWTCQLGAPPVKLKMIKPTKRDVARVAVYLSKPPHDVRNRMPKKGKPGRYKLMSTTEGYRPGLALRMLEGASQIELTSLMFGVGDLGSLVRQQVRHELEAWHRLRSNEGYIVPADFDVWRFWLELHQQRGNKRYLPFRIDRLPTPKRPRAKSAVVPTRKRLQRDWRTANSKEDSSRQAALN